MKRINLKHGATARVSNSCSRETIDYLNNLVDIAYNLKFADITFDECLDNLKEILNRDRLEWIPISDIPKVLLEDFKNFNIGNTMALVDDVECIPYRDFRNWYNKIMYGKGIDYKIKFKI